MAETSSILSTLISGGLGATIGGVVTATIQVFSHRGESKAAAADLITKAAGSMVERFEQENKQLRKAVLLLIEVLDDVTPNLDGAPDVAKKLNQAKRAAERAVL